MVQAQRDDRRRVRQETVELWGIERGRGAGQRRSGQRRPAGESQQRGRQKIVRQTGQSGQRRFRQEREVRQTEQSRQTKASAERRRPRQEQEVQLIRQSGQRRPRQTRAVSHHQEEALQYILPVEHPGTGNPRPVKSIRRRRARRRKIFLSRVAAVLFVVLCLALIYQATGAVYRYLHRDMIYDTADEKDNALDVVSDDVSDEKMIPPEIIEDYLEVNDYSRPGTKLEQVNSIFVHYTANPKTSAKNNRSYFANLAQTHEREASAHLIIGYDGEIIQCIPFDEQAYGVISRNNDSLSIECCYLNEDGSFTPETYETLLHTLAWLLEKYNLTTDDILRHYDCGGKKCPLYYVEHEDAWEKLLADVEAYEAPTE